MHKIGFYILIIICITSCDPFESVYGVQCANRGGNCPPYSDFMIKPLLFSVGDSIQFKNDFGFDIGFRVDAYNLNVNTGFSCQQTGSASCYCQPCHQGQGFEISTNDVPWPTGLNIIKLGNYCTYQEGNLSQNKVDIQLFDAFIYRTSTSPLFPYNEVYHESYELGGIAYPQVYVIDVSDSESESISKVYVSMQYGIIGFDETETPSTFYLTF